MTEFALSDLPTSITVPDTPVTALLDAAVAQYPDKTAIDFFGVRLTYRQFDEQIQKFMNVLKSVGVKKGEPVSIMSANSPQCMIAYQAILRLGAIVVETNPLYVAREVREQYNDAGIRVAVVTNLFRPIIEEVFDETPLEKVIITRLDDYMPWLLGRLFNIKLRIEKRYVAPRVDTTYLAWADELARAATNCEPEKVTGDDTALYLYTGGTTGASKGVILTHRNIHANALQCATWFLGAEEGKETFLLVLPLFHAFGMTAGMNMAIAFASTMVVMPKFDAGDALKNIEKHRVTLFPGVPAMFNAMNNHKTAASRDISSIKACVSGAAPLPQEVKEKFERLTGGKLVEGYGLSEASPVTHCNPLIGKFPPGSIGLPLPSTECKIVDSETGEELPLGAVGEIAIRGPQVMQGYRNRPDDTAASLKNGWLITGDLGSADERGFVYMMDRKKEMIITGGFNVYPKEVEEILYTIDGVLEAAVIGMPDKNFGESVVAVIVKKPDASLTADDVGAVCKKELGKFKVPRRIVFRDELPKTIIGKVLKRVLKEELTDS